MGRRFSLSPFLYSSAAIALAVCLAWISSKLHSAVHRRVRAKIASSPRLRTSQTVMMNTPSMQRTTSLSTRFRFREAYIPPNSRNLSSSRVELIVGIVIWTVNLCAFTICVTATISHFPDTSLSCITTTRICGPLYTLIKTMIYLVALYRIQSVYSGSCYEYDARLMRVLYFIVIASNVFLEATVIWVQAEHVDLQRIFGKSVRMIECLGVYPDWVVALVAVQDLIINAVCLHMFTKPLLLILKDSDRPHIANEGRDHSNDEGSSYSAKKRGRRGPKGSRSSDHFSEQMKRVASKFVVSSWTMIISTFLGLCAVVFTQTFSLLAIDLVINTLSVFFLTKWFDDSYGTVCAIPIMIARLIPGCQVPERMGDYASEEYTPRSRRSTEDRDRRLPMGMDDGKRDRMEVIEENTSDAALVLPASLGSSVENSRDVSLKPGLSSGISVSI